MSEQDVLARRDVSHADRTAPPGRPRVLQIGGLAGPGSAAGGVWAVARTQTTALAAAGARVRLAGGWLGPDPRSHERADELLFRVRPPFRGAALRGLISLALPVQVVRLRRAVDVVHVHLCRDFITTVSSVLLAATGVPVVAQGHGMLRPAHSRTVRAFDRLVMRRVLRLPRMWLTLTDREERDLADLGVDRARMRRVVNASDAVPAPRRYAPDPVFVFVSRLAERKQPAVFVAAALVLLDRGVKARFVLAGPDQGERARVAAMIDGSTHRAAFEVLGEQGPAEVARLMAGATALVLPSREEPYPMVVIEAAALGVPTILTAECGLAAALRDADAGLVTAPAEGPVAAAMQRIAREPGLADGLGARARDLHRRLWTTRALAARLVELYTEAGR